MKVDQNLQINLVFCFSNRLLFLRMYVFSLITSFTHIFYVKIQLFATIKYVRDLDLPGFALVWLPAALREKD
jgi:hypothetical protein